jgi:ribosome-associated protein
MRHQVSFCDYFVIASGNSERHVGAIADALAEELDKLGVHAKGKGAKQRSNWIVFDAGDIVAHIFHKEVRAFYNLEGLWQDAKEVNWKK